MIWSIEMVTDTATLAIFDIEALRHRINDDADWWTIKRDAVAEMNSGNALFAKLGSDGKYVLNISDEAIAPLGGTEGVIKTPSKAIFIGPADVTISEGLEPDLTRGGTFINVTALNYRVRIVKKSAFEIDVALREESAAAANQFEDFLRLSI